MKSVTFWMIWVWYKANFTVRTSSYQEPSHDGGVMLWRCFAASEPGQLAVVEGTMNSLYQKILKVTVEINP